MKPKDFLMQHFCKRSEHKVSLRTVVYRSAILSFLFIPAHLGRRLELEVLEPHSFSRCVFVRVRATV